MFRLLNLASIYSVNGNFNYLHTFGLNPRKLGGTFFSTRRSVSSSSSQHLLCIKQHPACFPCHSPNPSLITIRLHFANGFDYTVTRPARWRVYKQNVRKTIFFVWTNVALKCRKQFCITRNTQNIRSFWPHISVAFPCCFFGCCWTFCSVMLCYGWAYFVVIFWKWFLKQISFSCCQRKWIWIKMESSHSMNL